MFISVFDALVAGGGLRFRALPSTLTLGSRPLQTLLEKGFSDFMRRRVYI